MQIVRIADSEVNFVWKFEAKMTEILRYYVMLTVGYTVNNNHCGQFHRLELTIM